MIRRAFWIVVVGWCLYVGARNAGAIEAVVDLIVGAAIMVALVRRMPEALRAIGNQARGIDVRLAPWRGDAKPNSYPLRRRA